MKKDWKISTPNPRLNENLARAIKSTPLFAQLLINRGLSSEKEARLFLRSYLSQLHNPFLFKDMERAVMIIEEAIKKGEVILIYGDYDVDGITSTAILYKALKLLGARVDFYIPHRLKEGYGLNNAAVKKAGEAGTDLIITCDCGTNDYPALEIAKKLGLKVIITDHHETNIKSPPEFPLINPKRKDSNYPYRDLAGVGVAFKLVQALLEKFNFPNRKHWEVENLDLVALGTMADAVPLTGENRVIVKHGLKRLEKSSNLGIRALKQVSGLKSKNLNCKKVCFVLAPRINAAGRLKEGSLGVKLLTTEVVCEAEALAGRLDVLNKERQALQETIYKEAMNKVDKEIDLEKERIIFLSDNNWHLGVIGIVASRLAEKFLRPVFLISMDEVNRGSARSVSGFPLHEILAECKEHLINFGGHEYAAGLTVEQEQMPLLHQKLKELGSKFLPVESPPEQIQVDVLATLEEITPLLLEHLNYLAPFGRGNPAPVFLSRMLKMESFPRIVGRNHLKFMVRKDSCLREVIGFGFGGQLSALLQADTKVDILYSPEINDWQGESFIQLNLKDLQIFK